MACNCKTVFRFINDEETDKIEQLMVDADKVDMRSENERHWFVAWKGERVVATVNAEFVVKLFKKIRKSIAKRFLKISLKIISELSWEELDSLFPKPDYKNCFNFKSVDWSNVKFTYPYVPITDEQREDAK